MDPPDRGRRAFWLLALVIGVYLVAFAGRWSSVIHSYESYFLPANKTEEAAASNRGRIFLDNDSCYWIGYAQEMARTGAWRIRHTEFDNTPQGRPVHWSQSISWLLLLAGSVRHLATGEALPFAIEQAAHWIGPLQAFLLIVGTGYLLFVRLGLVPAAIWMLNLMTIIPVQWSFHPMRPDHHGLHLALVLSGLICLVLGGLGWTRSASGPRAAPGLFTPLRLPDQQQARRYFIAAGILGGLGVWTGASVQLFGVGLFAAGALLLVFFMPAQLSGSSAEQTTYEPSLWRLWAITGAVTSLAFYLVEYAPSLPGMRLEINHPLYAVSWLCVGELLTRLSARKMRGAAVRPILIALLCLGALLLPGLLFLGPSEWHAMRDPMMQRMHRFIGEFRPYQTIVAAAPWRTTFFNFGLLPAFVVLAPFLTDEKRTTLYEWAALWMAFVPALAFAGLTLWQSRWMNCFAASSLLLAVVTLSILWRDQNAKGRVAPWFYALTAAVAAQSLLFAGLQIQVLQFRDLTKARIPELTSPILKRQFAGKLGALDTNGTFRLMAAPDMAARLYFFGHLPSVASYYWENLEGLRAAASFFATDNDEEARRIAQERGITHVVLPPINDVARMLYYVKNGYSSEAGARDSMAGRLLTQPDALPSWIGRDAALERSLQPGYLFDGQPAFGTLRLFVIRPDQLNAGIAEP